MRANRRLLLRTLTTASHTLLNSAAAAAAIPKKKFSGGTPPTTKSLPPKTIQWKEDICNSASFIGTVTRPVKRVATSSRVGACTSLLVQVPSDPNRSFRILLKMWGEIAEMCLEHIKEKDFLHVSGRVDSYTKIDEKNNSQTFYEVIVKEINYVAESEHSPINKNGGKLVSGGESGLEKYRARLQLWQLFFTKPSEWHDNRKKKVKSNHPDFNHKDTGEALWISDRDPPWVKVQLQRLDSKLTAEDRKGDSTSNLCYPVESSLEKYRARLQLWQLFFTKPSEWRDNRKKKVKSNHPDFKHKDTGEALWISNRDPPWVKVQLQRLDSKLAAEDRKGDSTSNFSTLV